MELRRALEAMPDVRVLYVMADEQVNAKAVRFIDGNGLRDRITFLRDPGSRAIDALRLRKPDPEPLEAGVPHPSTYVLDRNGVVRLVDVRENYHFWLDPTLALDALRALEPTASPRAPRDFVRG